MPQNFAGEYLRGRSFKGQDLTGANFSRADIRSADFTGANLTDANFTNTKAGLTDARKAIALIGLFALASLTGIFSFFLSTAIAREVRRWAHLSVRSQLWLHWCKLEGSRLTRRDLAKCKFGKCQSDIDQCCRYGF